MNIISFKKRLEYREFAIRNSWKGKTEGGSRFGNGADGIEDDLNERIELLEDNIADASASKELYEYGHQIYSNRRYLGKIIVFLKKGVRKFITVFLGWYIIPFLRRQSFFNAKALNAVALTHETEMRLYQKLNEEIIQLRREVSELREANSALKDRLESEKASTLAKFRSIEYTRAEYTPAEDEEFYHLFEERFRGDRELIKSRLQVYIPMLQEHISDFASAVFIDVGSGRGEWLDVIKTCGAVNYTGVDINVVQNDVSRGYGHNVVCADCIEYLSKQEEGSVDVITGFQLIEHLNYYDIAELLKQCYRALKTGGVILFETPNPKNIVVGADTFYIDPSHHRPLPPEYMELCVEWQGFIDVKIIPANSHELWEKLDCSIDNQDLTELTKQFNDIKWLLYGPQDYAVFAMKG